MVSEQEISGSLLLEGAQGNIDLLKIRGGEKANPSSFFELSVVFDAP